MKRRAARRPEALGDATHLKTGAFVLFSRPPAVTFARLGNGLGHVSWPSHRRGGAWFGCTRRLRDGNAVEPLVENVERGSQHERDPTAARWK